MLPSSLFNPLNTDLNPVCHFLAILGAQLILHVSRIRVNPCPLESHASATLHAALFIGRYVGSFGNIVFRELLVL